MAEETAAAGAGAATAGDAPKAEISDAVGGLLSGSAGGVEKAGSWEAAAPKALCPSSCALLNPDSVAGGVVRSAPVGLDEEAKGSNGLFTTPRDEVGGEGGGEPKGETLPAKGLNDPASGCSGPVPEAGAGADAKEAVGDEAGAGAAAGLVCAVPGGGLPNAENAGTADAAGAAGGAPNGDAMAAGRAGASDVLARRLEVASAALAPKGDAASPPAAGAAAGMEAPAPNRDPVAGAGVDVKADMGEAAAGKAGAAGAAEKAAGAAAGSIRLTCPAGAPG